VPVRVSPPHHRIDDRAAVLHAEIDVTTGRSRPPADLGQDPDIPEQLVLLEEGSYVRRQLRYRQWVHSRGILPRLPSVLTGNARAGGKARREWRGVRRDFEGEGGGGGPAASESIMDRPWLCCRYRFPRVHPCFGMHTSTLFILTNINISIRIHG